MCFTVVKEIKVQDFHSERPTPAPNNSLTEAIFASNCTVCELNCLHNGTFIMALIYLSSSFSFSVSQEEKSFLVSLLPCLFPFLSQLLFHEIWLLVFSFFSISFSAKPDCSLLPCQPCLSAHYNVPKISPYQEAILKLHSATFVISFQEWAFMEIQKTTHLKNSTCLCSTSHVAVCLLIWVCLTTCFGQSTRAPQTSTESQTAILSPRIIYTLM